MQLGVLPDARGCLRSEARLRRCAMKTKSTLPPLAGPIGKLHVADAMHPGMISCPAETSLHSVARMMATHRVHAVFVHDRSDEPAAVESWGVVTDRDLLLAALTGELDTDAGRVAAAPVLAVTPTAPLGQAMQLMREHEVAHLVIVDGASGRPAGVLSTLDVASAIAGHTQTPEEVRDAG
jgi:CBS domain-containing protein